MQRRLRPHHPQAVADPARRARRGERAERIHKGRSSPAATRRRARQKAGIMIRIPRSPRRMYSPPRRSRSSASPPRRHRPPQGQHAASSCGHHCLDRVEPAARRHRRRRASSQNHSNTSPSSLNLRAEGIAKANEDFQAALYTTSASPRRPPPTPHARSRPGPAHVNFLPQPAAAERRRVDAISGARYGNQPA